MLSGTTRGPRGAAPAARRRSRRERRRSSTRRGVRPTAPTTPEGFALTARDILKSSAKDLGYDSWTQGAGSVDALRAVQLAAGIAGAVATPSEWRPGDYRGTEYDVFPNVLAAGESDSQTFDLDGAGTYELSDRYLTKIDSETFPFTTSPISQESVGNFNVPDYLIDISDMVAAHPNADMIAISANFNLDEFDVDHDYAYDQRWRLLAYDWTDINGDGNLWTDKDHDGAVDHKDFNKSSNIDVNADVKWDSLGDRPVRVRALLATRAPPRTASGSTSATRPSVRPMASSSASSTRRRPAPCRSPTSRSGSISTRTRTGAGSPPRPLPAARSTPASTSPTEPPPGCTRAPSWPARMATTRSSRCR